MKCEKCGNEHDGSYGSGRFCSRACANSRKLSDKTKQQISKSVHSTLISRRINKRLCVCEVCKSEFFIERKENGRFPSRRFCSEKCRSISYFSKQHITSKKCGGYKPHGGKGKRGWYKGYWCDSTWELAWIIYQLDHNVKFSRNTKGFPYEYNGEIHEYHPDFILSDGSYVEIKGWYNDLTHIKHKAFIDLGYKLQIIDSTKIDLYLDYVKTKYGNNLVVLYEKE